MPFFDHTAFKLYSFWHVGYLHDNLYGFYVCSRVSLVPYNPARCPDSPEPPLLLGFVPSYFPAAVRSHPPPCSPPPSNVTSPSSALRSSRSMSYVSSLDLSPASSLPTSVLSINRRTSAAASSLNRVFRSAWSHLSLTRTFLAHSFRSMELRCLRHFWHSSKRWLTV